MQKKAKRDFGPPIDDFTVDPADVGKVIELEQKGATKPKRQTSALLTDVQNNPKGHTSDLLKISGIEVALPADIEDRWRYAIDKTNMSAISAAQAGYALLCIKEELGHGEFVLELDKRGLKNTVSKNNMRIAKLLMEMPENIQKSLTQMSKSQLVVIAKLEPEQIEMLAESDDFDELSQLSVRELDRKLRRTEMQSRLKDIKIEELEESALAAKHKSNKWPEPVLHVREEAALANLHICNQADELERLMDEMRSMNFQVSLDKNPEVQQTQLNAAASQVWQAVVTAANRVNLLVEVYRSLGLTEFGLTAATPDLDQKELRRIGTLWQTERLLDEMKAATAKAKRTNNARKGKPGRPKKV